MSRGFENKQQNKKWQLGKRDVETPRTASLNYPHNDENKMKMRNGNDRLQSFKTKNWNNPNVSTKNLAEAGFYYSGEGDKVTCAFCKIQLEGWSHGVTPIREHFRQNPRCRFIAGYNVGNTPIEDDPIRGEVRLLDFDVAGPYEFPSSGSQSSSNNTPSSSQGSDVTTLLGGLQCSDPVTEDENTHKAPKHPKMAIFQQRLKSYPSNWSELCPISAPALSEAGFFHQGAATFAGVEKKDAVKCFHCGLLLFDWDENDEPWAEHRKVAKEHNLSCVYLRLNYGSSSSCSSMSEGSDNELEETLKEQPRERSSEENAKIRCKVCLDKDASIFFVDCKHMVTCPSCAATLSSCPVCRTEIKTSMKVFM